MAIETLYENPWVSLKKVVAPERGINGYVFSREERCHGCIIAVLPYRQSATSGELEYMVKCEVTPCWSLEPALSSLTGGWEGGPPVEDAQRELEEEAGYRVPLERFIKLGQSFASKSSDTRYELYAVGVTGVEPGEAKGDGSRLEAEATCVWLTEEGINAVMDPQVHVMHHRLKAALKPWEPSA